MNASDVMAAKAFLRDAYEREYRRAPTEEELLAWALQQWAKARRLAPRGTTPGSMLGQFVDSKEALR